MADPNWAVAISGGTGAILGSGIAEALRWLRDRAAAERTEVYERRRLHHDHYLEIMTYLEQLDKAFQRYQFGLNVGYKMENARARAGSIAIRDEIRDSLMGDPLTSATAKAEIVGSEALRSLFARLNGLMVTYALPISEQYMDCDIDGLRAAPDSSGDRPNRHDPLPLSTPAH